MATIQVKRGLAAGLPTLASGEPGWTTDTNALYVGTGAGNVLIGPGAGATSPLTTKGDVWVYTTTDARLPVGTNGQVLTADSAEAAGMKWAAPAAGYTDEEAQDAVGTILADSSTIDFSYNDGTPSITADVKDGSVTYAKIQDVSATARLLGRYSTGAGDVEEISLSGLTITGGALHITSVTAGQVLGRGSDFGPGVVGGRDVGTGLTISQATGLELDVPVVATHGGTGQTTWTTGDLLYASAANTLSKLAVGSAGEVLSVASGIPDWTTQGLPTPQGRLTLTTALPVTTADVTAAATLYYTPHVGSLVPLYDGSAWRVRRFTELSLSLAGLTTSLPHDVFLYDNAGTLTLEAVAWTNTTTRATALARQDGTWVKNGATGRLYLGTFYTTATGQTEDSYARRCVWNAYSRALRPLKVTDSTDSWNYTTATWRQARASSANQVDYVCGLADDPVSATVQVRVSNNPGATASVGVGVDSTSSNSATLHGAGATTSAQTTTAVYRGFPGIGYHYLAWLEYSQATGTTTWYGDLALSYWSHGMVAEVWG